MNEHLYSGVRFKDGWCYEQRDLPCFRIMLRMTGCRDDGEVTWAKIHIEGNDPGGMMADKDGRTEWTGGEIVEMLKAKKYTFCGVGLLTIQKEGQYYDECIDLIENVDGFSGEEA